VQSIQGRIVSDGEKRGVLCFLSRRMMMLELIVVIVAVLDDMLYSSRSLKSPT